MKTKDLSVTNLSEPLVEVNEMLTLYLICVQRELKSTVTDKLVHVRGLLFHAVPRGLETTDGHLSPCIQT